MNSCSINRLVAHDLCEGFGLQVQVDFRDDISTTQHTFKAVCLQNAMQLWQQIKYRIDKSVKYKDTLFYRNNIKTLLYTMKISSHRSIKGGKCLDTLLRQTINLSSTSFFLKSMSFVIVILNKGPSFCYNEEKQLWVTGYYLKTTFTFRTIRILQYKTKYLWMYINMKYGRNKQPHLHFLSQSCSLGLNQWSQQLLRKPLYIWWMTSCWPVTESICNAGIVREQHWVLIHIYYYKRKK